MFFRQFYDPPLAQASYLVGCQQTGDAIVIDPTRDVSEYVRVAKQENLRITFVTETHIHADFVSGSRELSARTGAAMLLSAEGGHEWQYGYAASDNATLLRDGEQFMVGNIRFDVLHTPGHTPEHLSFVVTDTPAAAGPMGVFTGDFVFVGDVGRPDLLEKAAQLEGTMEASARTLFASLQRFRALPDHLQVWPGHGAGSACGKALGAVPFSTVGYEKLANWALNIGNEGAFLREVLSGQPDPPTYFARMKQVNRDGPRVLRGISVPEKLPPSSIHELMGSKSLVIDTRAASAYAEAHVPGTLNIPYNLSFTGWAGWLLPADKEITLLVAAAEHERTPDALVHALRDLAGVGIDRVGGWLDQSALTAWTDAGHELGHVRSVTVPALVLERANGPAAQNAQAPLIIDVRKKDEWNHGHIPDARHIPLGHLLQQVTDVSRDAPIVVHCQSGGRSAIATSALMQAGFTNVRNLTGGIVAWEANNNPVDHE
ncbi:MAG: MBL fold metallo-hydrolase [Phycisphaerae bacterium]|nr:MBL fold metallo-hydrolase [Gemmatimonadaceae bacterium]